MNTAFFYDFETQGLPDFGQPSEAPHQPHIVSAAGKVINLDTREVIDQIDVLVKPDGWTIPEDVVKIHGISTERALAEGIPEADMVARVLALADSRTRIGYNESFDARMFRIALFRFRDEAAADAWKVAPAECAAIKATPIVKAPPTAKMIAAKRFHPKKPTLTEAYMHFFGEPMQGAHTAMGDVDGLIAVWFAMLDNKSAA